MTFIEKTGQTERVRRDIAVMAAGNGVVFGSLFSGNGLMIPVGMVGVLAAFVLHARAIRCPRCGYNLSWHALTKLGVGRSGNWLQTVEACPNCHLGEADTPAPPSPHDRAAGSAEAPGGAAAAPSNDGIPVPPEAFPPPPPNAPWRTAEPLVEKPGGSGYGYVQNGKLHPATHDELLRRYEVGVPPLLVWTPETPRPTWFQDVPELLDRYRAARVRDSRYGHWGPLAFFATVLVGMLTGGEPVRLGAGPAFWLAGSALLLGIRLYAHRSAQRLDAAAVQGELDDAWHSGWLRGQSARLTQVLIGGMIVVFLAQELVQLDPSFQVAGMLPDAVRRGEWWRLLSYGVMHGGLLHIGLNLLAMWSLGKLMEVHANRALLSPVLLAGIVGGGLVGLVIGPGVPMVGVSGGLLGLIGFLAIVGFRRRDRVPHGFGASMLKDVAFVAAVGLVGFRMIANAGHLGGLLAGVALGAVLVPRPRGEPRVGWAVGPAMAALGWICTAVLVATCAATAVYLFIAPG